MLAALVTGAGTSSDLALRVHDKEIGTAGSGAVAWVDPQGKVHVVGPSQRGSVPDRSDWRNNFV